jgi:hypothetical protein
LNNEIDVDNFNLMDNWSVKKKKKPPDKIINVELMCRQGNVGKKIKKPSGKRKKRRRKERFSNEYQLRKVSKNNLIEGKNADQNLKEIRSIPEKVEKFILKSEELLLENRSEVNGDQVYLRNDLGVSLIVARKTIQVTEGERRTRIHNIIIGDEDDSKSGYGYVIDKKRNNQRTHSSRGNHQALIFASLLMKEEDLEAGAYARFKSCKLMNSFRREENMFEIYSLNGD